jgi:hypothetical protein
MASYGLVTCRFCKKKLPADKMERSGKRFYCSESCAREEGEHELADRLAEERKNLLEKEELLRLHAAVAQAAADAERKALRQSLSKYRRAFLLWIPTGFLGGHRFYLGHRLSGALILVSMVILIRDPNSFPPAYFGFLLFLFDFFWLAYRSIVPKSLD